jgi:hypothetical protein
MDSSIPRINLTVRPLPLVLLNVMRECLSVDATARPTITSMSKNLEKVFPKQSVLESILMRLQRQFEEMESQVQARTIELTNEAGKIDNILKEMIPS